LGQALPKSVRGAGGTTRVAYDLENRIPKLSAHEIGQCNSKRYASRSLEVRLGASPYYQRINIKRAQSLTVMTPISAAQDIGGTARFPGTMKLVRVPEFYNNPLYLLALKMLRFDIRNVAVFFRWNRKGGAPVNARMRWTERDFEAG
jgi:hypothetical protein